MARLAWPVVFMVLEVGGCKARSTTSEPSPGARATAAASGAGAAAKLAPPPAVDDWMDVARLLQLYKDNRAFADSKITGKRIRIAGRVGEIKKDPANHAYLTVGAGAGDESPVAACFFGEEHAKEMAALVRGAKLTLDCTCQGLSTDVTMKDCEIPSYAMRVCNKLVYAGIAAACKQDEAATPIDSVRFTTAPIPGRNVYVEGKVDALQNQAAYAQMLSGLKAKLQDLGQSTQLFASPTSRVVVILMTARDSIPADIQEKTKGVVDGL
jgi:hypothetical protein